MNITPKEQEKIIQAINTIRVSDRMCHDAVNEEPVNVKNYELWKKERAKAAEELKAILDIDLVGIA